MIKIIFLSTLLILSFKTLEARNNKFSFYSKVSKKLMRLNFYYATIPYLKEALYIKDSRFDQSFDKIVEFNMRITGRTYFEDLTPKLLERSNTHSFKFIKAQKLFFKGFYDEAKQLFLEIPRDHSLYPNSLFFIGSIFELQKSYKKAFSHLQKCRKEAKSADFNHSAERVGYEYIGDSCEVSMARTLYKMGKNKGSSTLYNRIANDSFKWPDSLIEDSWNSYKNQDYHRTIGRLFAFKAPFLKGYNYVETEILKVLSFVKLCLWSDAVRSIDEYNQNYYKYAEKYQRNLRSIFKDQDYFSKLLKGTVVLEDSFLENFIRGISVRPLFTKFKFDYRNIIREEKRVTRISNKKLAGELLFNLAEVKEILIKKFHRYVYSELKFYVEQINKGHIILGKIKLNIYSKKKKSIMAGNPLGLDDQEIISIVRKSNQYYWGNIKEFWLDEIGQYVYGAKSQCLKPETIK